LLIKNISDHDEHDRNADYLADIDEIEADYSFCSETISTHLK